MKRLPSLAHIIERDEYEDTSQPREKNLSSHRGRGVELKGFQFDDQDRLPRLTPPADLKRRLRHQLPAEILRETDEYVLSAQIGLVEESSSVPASRIVRAPNGPTSNTSGPSTPIRQWLIDRVIGDVGRRRAPVITSPRLAAGECAFLMRGLIPNRKGQPLIAEWKTVVRRGHAGHAIEDFDAFCAHAGLTERGLPNAKRPLDLVQPRQALGDAVATMQLFVEDQVRHFSAARAA